MTKDVESGASRGAGVFDEIRLVGLGGVGRHGVLPEERRDGQTFLADLVLGVDTRAAAASDDLADTVDYAEIAQQVIAIIEGEPVNLVETLAARIADAALATSGVRAVTVTVHKPEAPVGVPFTDVQVTIHRAHADLAVSDGAPLGVSPAAIGASVPAPSAAVTPAVVAPAAAQPEVPNLDEAPDQPAPIVLALGSNVGEVRATLRAAVAELEEADGITVEEVSPLARTAAVLAPDAVAQPDYLNAVVLATTTLSPRELLALTQELENSHGRERAQRWGERTLDVDIITYGGVTSSEADLTLPHPRANERAFVLVPWAQADPNAFLPGLGGGPVAALAETAVDRSGVRWLALDWLEEPQSAARPPVPASAEPASAPEPPPEPTPALHGHEEFDSYAESGEDLDDLELLAQSDALADGAPVDDAPEDESEAATEPGAEASGDDAPVEDVESASEPGTDDAAAESSFEWMAPSDRDAPSIEPRWQPLNREE